MKAKLIKIEDGYNLITEQPQGRLLEATCSPSQQLKLDKSGASAKYNISKQNCDELFGIVDVEKLAEKEYPNGIDGTNRSSEIYRRIYIEGINKKTELDKDKVFTDKDMIEFAKWVFLEVGQNKNLDRSNEELLKEWKSLQQPKEIEVEIMMDDSFEKNRDIYIDENSKGNYYTHNKTPKFDVNGCLILKKKV